MNSLGRLMASLALGSGMIIPAALTVHFSSSSKSEDKSLSNRSVVGGEGLVNVEGPGLPQSESSSLGTQSPGRSDLTEQTAESSSAPDHSQPSVSGVDFSTSGGTGEGRLPSNSVSAGGHADSGLSSNMNGLFSGFRSIVSGIAGFWSSGR